MWLSVTHTDIIGALQQINNNLMNENFSNAGAAHYNFFITNMCHVSVIIINIFALARR